MEGERDIVERKERERERERERDRQTDRQRERKRKRERERERERGGGRDKRQICNMSGTEMLAESNVIVHRIDIPYVAHMTVTLSNIIIPNRRLF